MPWCDLTTGEDLELEDSIQSDELARGIHSAPFELLNPEGVAFNLALEQCVNPVDDRVDEGQGVDGDEEAVGPRAEEQEDSEGTFALEVELGAVSSSEATSSENEVAVREVDAAPSAYLDMKDDEGKRREEYPGHRAEEDNVWGSSASEERVFRHKKWSARHNLKVEEGSDGEDPKFWCRRRLSSESELLKRACEWGRCRRCSSRAK